MHLVVQEINSKLKLLENNTSYIDLIDENGNILIQHDETFPNLAQGFLLTAKRKRLRTLKDIAAYNVAKFLQFHLVKTILHQHSWTHIQEIISQFKIF
jgi:hypothetical protein